MYQNTGNQEKKPISPNFKELHTLKPAPDRQKYPNILAKMENLPISNCYIPLENIFHVYFQVQIYFTVSCVKIFRKVII